MRNSDIGFVKSFKPMGQELATFNYGPGARSQVSYAELEVLVRRVDQHLSDLLENRTVPTVENFEGVVFPTPSVARVAPLRWPEQRGAEIMREARKAFMTGVKETLGNLLEKRAGEQTPRTDG